MRTKNKMKNYLKLGMLFFGIAFVLTNCSTELEEEMLNKKTTLDLVLYKTELKKALKSNNTFKKHITQKFDDKGNSINLKMNSEVFGFSIDTSFVQIISSNSFTSYTFLVEREITDFNILENYIYTEYANGNISQLLVSYPIVEDNIEDYYDVNNATAQYIEDENLLLKNFGGCTDGQVEIVGWDENTNCVDYECSEGPDHTDYNCPGHWDFHTECAGGWAVIGCSSGGGGGGTPTDPTFPGGGTPTNPNDNLNDPDNDEVVAIIPFGDNISTRNAKKQCKKIFSQLNETDYNLKQELDTLMSKTNEDKEYSFEVLKNGAQNHRTGISGVGIPMPENSVSKFLVMAHSHDAVGEGDGTFSVFSFADLQSIAKYLFQNDIKKSKFVAYLVTEKGTRLALTINDSSKLLDFFYQYNHPTLPVGSSQSLVDKWTQAGIKEKVLSKKYYETKNDNVPIIQVTDTDNEEMLKQFLKFLQEADAGVSVFEALDNNYDFKRVVLSPLGNNVERKECN